MSSADKPDPSRLRPALGRITLAGSLAMVYTAGISSPVFTEFMLSLGANEFHFGLLGGIPMIMFIMQFAGAFMCNRLTHRKATFMLVLIVSRLGYLLIALIPLLWPAVPAEVAVPAVIAILSISWALANFAVPLWFSWMADMIPRPILNRYWGRRQRWMSGAWAVAYLAVAAFTFVIEMRPAHAFAVVAAIAVAAGVIDILLFHNIPEPTNMMIRDGRAIDVLLEPVRDANYRSFVLFRSCALFAMVFGSSFMLLYVLENLGMSLWQATLVWCVQGVGVAFASPPWGRLADRLGNRPIMLLCTVGKPLMAVVFLFVTPAAAPIVLPIAFLVDAILNAGILIASNGFMLKMAPQKNRSMFIAAMTGLSGICGGLGAIIGGRFLHALSDTSMIALGREWTNFHALFLLSAIMRILCIPLARRLHEPASASALQMLSDIRGTMPFQFLRFPIGLYRRPFDDDEEPRTDA